MFGPNGVKSVPTRHRKSYVVRARQVRYDVRCFNTQRGYIGFGPLATEVGSRVCVLEEHKAPVPLRRQGSQYIIVGDCDVVGIVNGEVLEAVKRGEAEIILKGLPTWCPWRIRYGHVKSGKVNAPPFLSRPTSAHIEPSLERSSHPGLGNSFLSSL